MAVSPSAARGLRITFYSADEGSFPSDTFEVALLEGQESISNPYRYVLELGTRNSDLQVETLLASPVRIGIRQAVTLADGAQRGAQKHMIHGVLAEFEEIDFREGWLFFRAAVVPHLWRLSLNTQTRVFLDKNVQEIAEEVLAGDPDLAYEFRLGARDYPKREYVLQYQEDDLTFLQRVLEHEGIAYFHRQDEEQETLVLTDANSGFTPIVGDPEIKFSRVVASERNYDWMGHEMCSRISRAHRLVPAQVAIADYNYRSPSVALGKSATVTGAGFGKFYEYGTHHKDSSEAAALALVRAEEIAWQRAVYRGASDAKSFRAGSTFKLTQHPRFEAEYLLVEVTHRAEQSVSLDQSAGAVAFYGNEFVAIPVDVPFRPRRVTPKPRISGTINARVDAAGDDVYAEIDDQGRYKVTMPFDQSGRSGGKASRYMRMAQPYAGGGFGMHFPLHKGAEVVVAHTNGDPDRPYIVASIPNPETASPVASGNHTQCVIKTGSDNQIVIEDTKGSERIKLISPHSNTVMYLGAGNEGKEGLCAATDGWTWVGSKSGIFICAQYGWENHWATDEAAGTVNQILTAVSAGLAIGDGALASGKTGTYAALVSSAISSAFSLTMQSVNTWALGGIASATPGGISLMGGAGAMLAGMGGTSIFGGLGGVDIGTVALGIGIRAVQGGVGIGAVSGDVYSWARSARAVLHAGPTNLWRAGSGTDVVIQADKDVIVTGMNKVQIHASQTDAELTAMKNVRIECTGAKDKITLYNGGSKIEIDCQSDPKITLQTGDSSILMEKEKITIQSPEIVLQTKDGKGKLQLDDGGSASALLYAKKDLSLQTDGDADFDTTGMLSLNGKKQIKVTTPDLDEKGADKINRANSTEGGP